MQQEKNITTVFAIAKNASTPECSGFLKQKYVLVE